MDDDETFFAADGRTSTPFVSGASPHPRRTPGDAPLAYSFLGSVRVSRDGSCSRVGTASTSGALQKLRERATSSAAARFAVEKSGSASAGGRVSRLRDADGGRRRVNIARKNSFSSFLSRRRTRRSLFHSAVSSSSSSCASSSTRYSVASNSALVFPGTSSSPSRPPASSLHRCMAGSSRTSPL